MGINLVDFGFITKYVEGVPKKHIPKQEVQTFKGNIIFSSLSQMKFLSTSRRDDLRSLIYLLIYCFKDEKIPLMSIYKEFPGNPEKLL